MEGNKESFENDSSQTSNENGISVAVTELKKTKISQSPTDNVRGYNVKPSDIVEKAEEMFALKNEIFQEQRNSDDPFAKHRLSNIQRKMSTVSNRSSRRRGVKVGIGIERKNTFTTETIKKISRTLTNHSIKMKQDWTSDEHEAPSWFELFTDLLFVGVIIKLANQFKYAWFHRNSRVPVIMEMLLVFVGFFILWLELCALFSRFHITSIFSSLLEFTYVIGILLCAVSIQENKPLFEESLRKTWALGFMISMISLTLVHAILFRLNVKAFYYATLRICVFGLASVMMLISLFVGYLPTIIILVFVFLLILIQSANSYRVTETRVPVNVEHFAERLGLIIMIALGESVLAIVTKYPQVPDQIFYIFARR